MAMIGAQFVQAVQPVPVGSLQAFAGANAPTGWLLCDGTSYSTSVYPDLFSALGYTYGGSGASFNVPDLRGRMPIGAGNDGTAANNATRTRGDKGGDTRLQSHDHALSTFGMGSVSLSPGGFGIAQNFVSPNLRTGSDGAGSGANMPPFLVTNYIIKALPDVPRQGLALGNTPPIVTALPANPQFGEVVTYVADATNGVYWDLQYDASGTYPWKFIGGAVLRDYQPGLVTTATSSVTSPSLSIPLPGDYRFDYGALVAPSSAGNYASVQPWWNSTVLPGLSSDQAECAHGVGPYYASIASGGIVSTLTTTGTVSFRHGSVSGTASFQRRWMEITPVRVKAA